MGFSRNYWIRKDFLLPRTMLWVRPRKDIIHSWDFAKRLSLSLNCTKSDLCVSDDLCLKCSNLTARAFNGRWPTENGFRKKTEMDFYLDQIVKSAIEHLGGGCCFDRKIINDRVTVTTPTSIISPKSVHSEVFYFSCTAAICLQLNDENKGLENVSIYSKMYPFIVTMYPFIVTMYRIARETS